MKKILILTVTAGEGHNSVAKALADKFKTYANTEVKLLDIYKECGNKFKCFIFDNAYRASCKYALGAYNKIYNYIANRDPNKRETTPVQLAVKNELPFLLKQIYNFKPDIIVTSHLYGAIALTNLKKIFKIDAKVGAILTDYEPHPFYESATNIDYIFTPCEDAETILIKKGFKKEQIKCFGLPVKENFLFETNKTETIQKLGLKQNMFTVMLMTGGGGFGGMIKLFLSLTKVNVPIQIISINGKDEHSKKKIDSFIAKNKSSHIFHNLGFVSNIQDYMTASDCMVGKCGGISSTETLCKKLPLISISKLTRQELGNVRFLQKNNACLTIDKNNKLEDIIQQLILFPNKLDTLRSNIEKIKKPNALKNICDFMYSFNNSIYYDEKTINQLSEYKIKTLIKTAQKKDIKNANLKIKNIKKEIICNAKLLKHKIY
ncbi:MAG: glycosyltransferase [Clostridia bacterium]